MDFDVVIVGSGPGGTAAALALADGRTKVAVIDVGNEAPEAPWPGSFAELLDDPERSRGRLLGDKQDYLRGVLDETVMAKLRAPLQRYVTANRELTPVEGHGFNVVLSHALGGLANIWGGQMLRFSASDLEDFPLAPGALDHHYDLIEDEMGISGADDDLSRFFGNEQRLQPPLEIDDNAADLLRRYRRLKWALNRGGVYIGRPRAAILTRPHNGRPATTYDGLEFFRPRPPQIYTPAFTLHRLIAEGRIAYRPGLLVTGFEDVETGVRISVRPTGGGDTGVVSARKLILCAGALASARLVLASAGDYGAHLPLLDNGLSYVPLLNPLRLGRSNDKRTSYLQLALCLERRNHPMVMGSFYSINGLLLSDFVGDLPVAASDALRLLPHVVPALLVLHLWHADRSDLSTSWVELDRDGTLHAHRTRSRSKEAERHLVQMLAPLGFLSLPSLIQLPPFGNSFHRCGTLPMKQRPARHQTDADGRLAGHRHVHVADASVLPVLPAKNLSLTLMANAHRIATRLKDWA